MSEGPEYIGGRMDKGELDIAGFDQKHAETLELLRSAKAFILLTFMDFGDTFGIRFKSAVPPKRDVVIAFAETLETVARELRKEYDA